MSLVYLRQYAALLRDCQNIGNSQSQCHMASDVCLSDAEREEARIILTQVAATLAERSPTMASMRRRLGAILEMLIAVADELDGDPDLEDGADQEAVCEDEGAQCDDEGEPNDNGIADAEGLSGQGFDGVL